MANEILASASLAYTNQARGIVTTALSQQPTFYDITGYQVQGPSTMSVPTTAGGTAIPKGGVGTPGWIMIKNLDATNYVDILTAVSGTAFCRLLKGEFALFRLTPALTAPAALANTAAVLIQYELLEN